MFQAFDGRTADEVWQKIASAFRDRNGTLVQPSRAGSTREIVHAGISIADPLQRWITSRYPPINPAFAIAEIVWIVTGRNDAEFLNYFNRGLPNYCGHEVTYHGAYGHRLRRHLGIDQLDRAYHTLKLNQQSRQVVLQIWDSKVDLPMCDGKEAAPDVPCNLMSMLKVRGGKLEWMQILRSNDIYRGLPYNIVQFTTLQEVMGGWLGLELGTYNQVSDSLHVYEDCLDYIQDSPVIKVAANTDSLSLPKKQSEEAFNELACQVELIISQDILTDKLILMTHRTQLPLAFRNMLCMLCAEGARRRNRPDVIDQIMADCTNLAYKQLYNRWLRRVSSTPSTSPSPLRV